MLSARELLEIEGVGARWTLSDFEGELAHADSRIFTIAGDHSSNISAFVLYRLVPDGIEIMNLAVREKAKGNGRKLIQSFLQSIQAALPQGSIKNVFLEVGTRNIAAVKLYSGAGFQELARRKNYYKDGDDAIVMRLTLSR